MAKLKSLNPTGAPPETKVFAQFSAASLTGVVTWVLTTFVFKGHLPPQLQTFLPFVIPTAFGLAAGWFAKHTPRLDAIAEEAMAQLQKYLASQPVTTATAAQTVRFTTPPVPPGGGTGGAGGPA